VRPALWDAAVWERGRLDGEPWLPELFRDELLEPGLQVRDAEAEELLEPDAEALELQAQVTLQLQKLARQRRVRPEVKSANESWRSVWAGD
jgi:hypothetical protein